MKHVWKSALSCVLAFLMLFGMCQEGIVLAVDDLDKALNPAERIPLTVPEQFQDGAQGLISFHQSGKTSLAGGHQHRFRASVMGDEFLFQLHVQSSFMVL